MGASIGTHDGATIWINLEPCGLICGMTTWFFLGYGMLATTYSVIVPWLGYSAFGCLNIFLFNFLSLVAMYCHLRAMTIDPGSVPKAAIPTLDDDYENDTEAVDRVNKYRRFCKRCKAFKPIRAHHCSICRRCIVKMDHHCPWVNNCVGIGNQKLFLLFIFYTAVVCAYSLVLVISRFAACAFSNLQCNDEIHFLMILFLFLESLLFLMFTLCMLGDQLSSMKSNQTSIDRLKNQKHDVRVDINEVCGSPLEINFQWRWLIPVAVSFSETLLDRIMGYRMSPKGGEYCIVCPSKEEATPLMDGEIELKAIEVTSESNKKESKSDVTDNAPLPAPGTRPAVPSIDKQQEESIGEGEEEGTWMGKSQGGEVHQQTNSFMRKRGGPP